MPPTSTFTTFSSPTSANSHFDKFDFKPENDENKEIVFSSPFIKPKFFKKQAVSSA